MLKFSAVICTFNRERFIKQSLQSLINQSMDPKCYEIIVVDNNSTDNTKPIVSEIVDHHPCHRIVYVRESRQGLSYARNTAWEIALGKYLYYLDDDGVACRNLLDTFYKILDSDEKIVGCGGKIIVKYDPKKPSWLPTFFERFYGDYDRGEIVSETEYVPGGNGAWRVSFLRESNGFNTSLGRVGENGAGCEESLLNMHARQVGYKLMYSPNAIMEHYAGPNRLNLKWLIRRMKGQGISSFTVDLIKSQNKSINTSRMLKADLAKLIDINLSIKMTEENVIKEMLYRFLLSVEKLTRMKLIIKNSIKN